MQKSATIYLSIVTHKKRYKNVDAKWIWCRTPFHIDRVGDRAIICDILHGYSVCAFLPEQISTFSSYVRIFSVITKHAIYIYTYTGKSMIIIHINNHLTTCASIREVDPDKILNGDYRVDFQWFDFLRVINFADLVPILQNSAVLLSLFVVQCVHI